MSIPVSEIREYPADRERPSPNHGPRTARHVSLIVLHATASSTDESAENAMANPAHKAAAHLHIRRDGSITRQVGDSRRAWHAGRSSWPGIGDVNSESLGWEIGNDNRGEPYTDAQYEAVADLLRHYLPQGLERDAVVSHAMIAPGRKSDPLGWDWGRMWRLVDPEPEWPDVPDPDVGLVAPEWTPEPFPTLEPVATLRRPARAVVAVTADRDESLGDYLRRVVEWLADQPEISVFTKALALWVIRKLTERLEPS